MRVAAPTTAASATTTTQKTSAGACPHSSAKPVASKARHLAGHPPNSTNNEGETDMFTTTTMFQGNLTADPTLRYTIGGTAVAEFRVLVSHRVKDGDQWVNGEPTGHNV